MAGELTGQAGVLTSVLGLERAPVAVTFTNDPVEDESGSRTWLCRALKLASEGRSFVVDSESSACPGGSWHCGLTGPPQGQGRRAIQQFLTKGEKLTRSIVSFHRMQALTSPPPTGLSDRILMSPMADAPLRPDIVVFLCNPAQACRLVTLDQYWDGIPPEVELAGSLCHSAISYPVVTGCTNLTLGDWTARRAQGFEDDTVFLSVPYERMHNLLLAVEECSAGTAETEVPEAFRRAMREAE